MQFSLRPSPSGTVPHIVSPSSFATQRQATVYLDSGLVLWFGDYFFSENQTFRFIAEDPRFTCIGFFLAGSTSMAYGERSHPREHHLAPACFLTNLTVSGTQFYPAGERIQHVGICSDLETIHRLLGEAVSLLPRPWRAEAVTPPDSSELSLALTPGMRMAAHEALHSFSGPTTRHRLLLESKALELITLCICHLARMAGKKTPTEAAHIAPQDRDKLHAARDILCDNLANPPTIVELAKLVGMNECKLKFLFKKHFKTTIYRYVRSQRMCRAKSLLEQGMSVSRAASEVGYINYSHFASVFHKQHGVLPSAFLKR